jgi:hypothetical protein
MEFLVILGDLACFAAGGAFIWFFRERIQALVIDANTLSAKLHAKANEIANAAKK